MKQYFGTDGIRGIANVDLSNEIVYKAAIGMAIEARKKGIEEPKVFIGRDTRISSEMFMYTLSSALISSGCIATDLGVIPTPCLSYLVKKEKQDFGIMISASHNPYNQNGIKIVNSEGIKISDEEEEIIEKYILGETKIETGIQGENLGRVEKDEKQKYFQKYIKDLKNSFKDLKLKGMNIYLDNANGSTYNVSEELFKSFGAKVSKISSKPDGININLECGATHPETLQKELRKKENKGNFDIGLIFDGDGDRLIVIDDKAKVVNGDKIISIIAMYLSDIKKIKKEIVFTIMTNQGIVDYLKNEGYTIYQTKVGDKYVFEKMQEENVNIGGEQSGHIIYDKIKNTGDGMQSALLLLSAMKHFNKKISELTNKLPAYPQVLINAEVNKDKKKEFMQIDSINKQIERIEKELQGRGRVLIRPSGTESLIRVMIEGEDKEQITTWAEDLAEMYHKQLS